MWRGFVYEVSSLIVDDVAYVADRAGEPVHCVVSRVRGSTVRRPGGRVRPHREVVLSNIE